MSRNRSCGYWVSGLAGSEDPHEVRLGSSGSGPRRGEVLVGLSGSLGERLVVMRACRVCRTHFLDWPRPPNRTLLEPHALVADRLNESEVMAHEDDRAAGAVEGTHLGDALI